MNYTIELTEEEVKTLQIILNNIGGSPTNSPRKFADSINIKIKDAAGDFYYDRRLVIGGEIKFHNFLTIYTITTTRIPF